ncbi:class I adenylate-forming enzyme family protein [Actinomadura sp. SCN-SB]|uniref:class I adenylate-forming enzyme family protein n=1 Tax=Actinomadura sp. SCN-SB TaxID=3373092 RepID=UPI003751E5EF
MHLPMLAEMAADASPDRTALVTASGEALSYADLVERARRVAALVERYDVRHVALLDENSPAVPVLLFGSALAGCAFVPLNYRWADEALRTALAGIAPVLVVGQDAALERVAGIPGVTPLSRETVQTAQRTEGRLTGADPDEAAVLLFTSGTSGAPKAAVLRHRHLVSYVVSTVDFMAADTGEAILVSVPPYHIAGISSVLTSVFVGRRMVQLPAFTPEAWVALARRESVTHAMVVPTMLGRILDVVERDGAGLPALRHLSYGGGRMPAPVVERALALLPDTGFVNAYGLTETSSTIAVLGPDEHRRRHKLGSVGRPLPSVEIEIRDRDGAVLPPAEMGEIWVRGDQVSGEYLTHRALTEDGWFPTRDGGRLDEDGYLYVDGRADDVIVRGGENLSPGEIEETLATHPAVAEAAVVGVPDQEWGERPEAVVVFASGESAGEEELRDWVRVRLRSAKTPTRIHVRAELPYNETGKLLRRVVRDDLARAATATETVRA